MFVFLNENRDNKLVGDCVVRAISTLLSQDWNTTYLGLVMQGYISADMPSSDNVWNDYLIHKGYERVVIPSVCPSCMTVREFSNTYKNGRYLLFVGGHVVACIDGSYYDTWDSGDKTVIYYFQKRKRAEQ